METETTGKTKVEILEDKIWRYNNTNYSLSLDARAARLTENKDLEGVHLKEIAKNEKIIDFLKGELEKEKQLLSTQTTPEG